MPDGPISVMLVPIASNTGRQRSNVSGSPPAMIVSVACSAPHEPPLTGASSIAMPRSANRPARACVSPGEIVLMSISTEPSAIAPARPSSPSTAASTSGVSGTIVITMLAARPTSAGEAATVTPSARSASAFAAVRL